MSKSGHVFMVFGFDHMAILTADFRLVEATVEDEHIGEIWNLWSLLGCGNFFLDLPEDDLRRVEVLWSSYQIRLRAHAYQWKLRSSYPYFYASDSLCWHDICCLRAITNELVAIGQKYGVDIVKSKNARRSRNKSASESGSNQ